MYLALFSSTKLERIINKRKRKLKENVFREIFYNVLVICDMIEGSNKNIFKEIYICSAQLLQELH